MQGCALVGASPNPACSGHGFAVGEPWGWSGKNPLPAVAVGRRRRAADAIVGLQIYVACDKLSLREVNLHSSVKDYYAI